MNYFSVHGIVAVVYLGSQFYKLRVLIDVLLLCEEEASEVNTPAEESR